MGRPPSTNLRYAPAFAAAACVAFIVSGTSHGEGQVAPETTPGRGPAIPGLFVDTHVDTPQRMVDGDDLGEALRGGHLDIPRMRRGGLTAAFFSIWVDPRRYRGEAAYRRALALVAAVRAVPERHPEAAALCTTSACVREAAAAGKVALLMGVEGAHALGTGHPATALGRLRELHRLGARYMTLTWSTDNPLGHSSTGRHPARGLTRLGRRVVEEMNRLGMIVDVSHVSDATFFEAVALSRAPVFASHSSMRALSDHPRNITDDMLRALAARGGAVCINYYPKFIDASYRDARRRLERAHPAEFAAIRARLGGGDGRGPAELELARRLDPDLERPGVDTLVRHFERAVRVGGDEAVCMGSDFDGIGELPAGLDDVAQLPVLVEALRRRGLPIRAIAAENVLRILDAQRPGATD
jgi:membrane dipeptidase